jgi:glucose-6-phosphate dehydrogenase assembly protein OpcA
MSTVSPERILHDLSALWVDLGKEAGEEGSAGVLRACTMTLVVLAGEEDDPLAIAEVIAQLMPEHPSRAILVRVTPSRERSLEARVFSQCWTAFGQRRHICAEQIEITSTAAALDEVPSVILPLTLPDFPVVLWSRGAHLFELAGFEGIASLATKVVVDGASFDRLQSMLQRRPAVGDLAWTRLTRWRELISGIFENRASALPRVAEVRVAFGAGRHSALYLAAWLLHGLRRAGANPRLEIQKGAPEKRVELVSPDLRVMVSQCEGRCAEIRINQTTTRAALPEPSEYALMREELAIPGHDPIFEQVLPAAAQLAVSS